MGQGVFGVDFERLAIVTLGFVPFAGVEINGAEVDQGAGGFWIQLDGLSVSLDNFRGGRAGLFKVEAALKPSISGGAFFAFLIAAVFGGKLDQPLYFVLVEVED